MTSQRIDASQRWKVGPARERAAPKFQATCKDCSNFATTHRSTWPVYAPGPFSRSPPCSSVRSGACGGVGLPPFSPLAHHPNCRYPARNFSLCVAACYTAHFKGAWLRRGVFIKHSLMSGSAKDWQRPQYEYCTSSQRFCNVCVLGLHNAGAHHSDSISLSSGDYV